MFTKIKHLATIVLTTFLVACGGGGGGTVTPAVPVDYQLKNAYVNHLTTTGAQPFTVSGNYTAGGTTYPITGSGIGTNGALSSATFEGRSALGKASTVTGSITMNGINAPLNTTSYSYVDSNYNFLGGSGSEYTVVTSQNAIPTIGHVNDTGNWYTANRYSTSAKTSLIGTRVTSYVIEQDSTNTAFLTIITIDKNTSGATTSTDGEKYRMTASGALTYISATGIVYGTSPVSVMTLTMTF